MKKSILGALLALSLAATFALATPVLAGGTFAIVNNFAKTSDNDIVGVYIYHNSPGGNQFKSGGYIVPGDQVEFTTSLNGCSGFKVKIVQRDGSEYYYDRVNVCGNVYAVDENSITLTGLDVADVHIDNSDLDRTIDIYNDYGVSITEVYATNTGDGYWGYDLLSGKIAYESSRTLNLNDHSGSCVYDVKVVAANGEEWIQNDFNVCSEAQLTAPF